MKYSATDYAELLLEELLEKPQSAQPDLLKRLAKLLQHHKQSQLQSDIIDELTRLMTERALTIIINVVSAQPLTNLLELGQTIASELGESVELTNYIKPDLLGGLVIYYQDYKIDLSAQSQLQKIKQPARETTVITGQLQSILAVFQQRDDYFSPAKVAKNTLELKKSATLPAEKELCASLNQKVIIKFDTGTKKNDSLLLHYQA